MARTPFAAAAMVALVFCAAVSARDYRLTVAASDVDRAGQVVTFKLPADAPTSAVLRGDTTVTALQVSPDGTAAFVVPEQKAGAVLSFVFAAGTSSTPDAAGVDVAKAGGRLNITVNGGAALVYQMDKEALPRPDIKPEYKRAGYLHPIYTPSGVVVSDDYPKQHVHHHGIWSPWTRTVFQGRSVDFWNMGVRQGTVEFVAVDRTWNGPVHGGFVARHRFVDLTAKPESVVALHEVWEVTVYNVGTLERPVQLFDLRLTQTCATNDPIILPKYHYGGLGFRGRGEWYGREKANFLTSDGVTDRVKANAQPMRWVAIDGAVETGTALMAVLGHPDNFRAPQPVRVHPNEPYVSFTPSTNAEWRIEPGQPYVARYRFVAADGAPDRARLEAFWQGYAKPAVVKLDPL